MELPDLPFCPPRPAQSFLPDDSTQESSIAWPSDVDHLYGNFTAVNYNDDPATRGGGTTLRTLQESQHWIVSLPGAGGLACVRRGARLLQAGLRWSRGGHAALTPAPTAPAVQVWMRPAGQVWVQKLYAKIDQDIPAGALEKGQCAASHATPPRCCKASVSGRRRH